MKELDERASVDRLCTDQFQTAELLLFLHTFLGRFLSYQFRLLLRPINYLDLPLVKPRTIDIRIEACFIASSKNIKGSDIISPKEVLS